MRTSKVRASGSTVRRFRMGLPSFVAILAGVCGPGVADANSPTLELLENHDQVIVGEHLDLEPGQLSLTTSTTGGVLCQSVDGSYFGGRDITNDSSTDRLEVRTAERILIGEHPCESDSSLGKTVYVAFGSTVPLGEVTLSAKGKSAFTFSAAATLELYFTEAPEKQCNYPLKTLKGTIERINPIEGPRELKLEFKASKLKLRAGSSAQCAKKATLTLTNTQIRTAETPNYWEGFTK